jgi:hypothetical protein
MGRKKGSKNKPKAKPKATGVFTAPPRDWRFRNRVLDYIQSRLDAWQRNYGDEDSPIVVERIKTSLESLKIKGENDA